MNYIQDESQPLVSVVIPAYNSGSLLGEAIDSVLTQTFQTFEIVVIDDGSTDNTGQLAQSYGSQVRYYRQENRGSSFARALGISKSQGKYIAALDSDDIWLPTKLQEQVKALETNPQAALCYTDGYRWQSGTKMLFSPKLSKLYGRGRSGWQFSYMFKISAAATSSMLFRRDAYDAVGGYDLGLSYCDAEFLIRLSSCYQFVYVDQPLMGYRVHGSNTSNKVTRANALSNLEFIRLLRRRASRRIQPDIGDFSVQLFRRGPKLVQWGLLLYWRLHYTSPSYTLDRLCKYARTLMASRLF